MIIEKRLTNVKTASRHGDEKLYERDLLTHGYLRLLEVINIFFPHKNVTLAPFDTFLHILFSEDVQIIVKHKTFIIKNKNFTKCSYLSYTLPASKIGFSGASL